MENYKNEFNKELNENEEVNYDFNPFNSNVEFDNKNLQEYDIKYDDDIPTFKLNKEKIGNVNYEYEKEKKYENNDVKNDEINIKKRERLVNLIINLYKKIKEFTYQISTIDENKLLNWQAKGKINAEILNYEIFENEYGDPVTILDLINEFDTNLRITLNIDDNNICNLDKDFENALRKDLLDIFSKKNIGLSAEADLLILLFEDILRNIAIIATSRITLNTIIKQTSEKLGYKVNDINSDELNTDTLLKEKNETINKSQDLYKENNETLNNANMTSNIKLDNDKNKFDKKTNKINKKRGRPRKNKKVEKNVKNKNEENILNKEINNQVEEINDKDEIKKINDVIN